MTRTMNRKQVARGFFELLVLKSWDCVEVQQDEPYASLVVSKTVRTRLWLLRALRTAICLMVDGVCSLQATFADAVRAVEVQ